MLGPNDLHAIDAYWRAANYCSVGQIYLLDNPLLREPLRARARQATPPRSFRDDAGLNLIYAHLNRVIKTRDLDMIYVIGPGHGGRASSPTPISRAPTARSTPTSARTTRASEAVPSVLLSGRHPEPRSAGDAGLDPRGRRARLLARCTPTARRSTIPDLIVACVIGDGEAETAPLAASWHSNKFLDPVGDGAVLPILHLNGYKIANPTVSARIGDDELDQLLEGYGHRPIFVEGDEPVDVHQQMAAALDERSTRSPTSRPRPQRRLERSSRLAHDRLRTPKGWTCPKIVDGLPVEGTFRAHQVPVDDVRTNPEHLALLETWMRSYRSEELFDEAGRLRPELAALAPSGMQRMGANPHANGGLLLKDLAVPDFTDYAVPVDRPGATVGRTDESARRAAARRHHGKPHDVPLGWTRRNGVQSARGCVRGHRTRVGSRGPPRRRAPRTARSGHGGPE